MVCVMNRELLVTTLTIIDENPSSTKSDSNLDNNLFLSHSFIIETAAWKMHSICSVQLIIRKSPFWLESDTSHLLCVVISAQSSRSRNFQRRPKTNKVCLKAQGRGICKKTFHLCPQATLITEGIPSMKRENYKSTQPSGVISQHFLLALSVSPEHSEAECVTNPTVIIATLRHQR